MNTNQNASPWFTPTDMNYRLQHSTPSHEYNTQNAMYSGEMHTNTTGNIGTTYLNEDDEYANEPPLLEELGINFQHIWIKTQSVLIPTKIINEHILDDADLAGPLVYCFIFGMCLLLTAKVHFGYIYGFGVLSCIFLYLLMNLLSPERSIDIYRVYSVLGYCLLPIIGLAAINIILSVKDLGIIGFLLSGTSILWSTHTASRFFEKALYMSEQKYLIMYPTGLVYSCFVLITVF